MFLPSEIIPVLAPFAPAFTSSTDQTGLELIVGTLLSKGRRPVTMRCHIPRRDWW
ncbi:hypothetical protein BH10CHL1_BH10CHL1_51330 [soil metagenome]